MKPVQQDKFGAQEGNCFQAMLASILELPLEAVPDFMTNAEKDGWVVPLNTWLRQFGLGYLEVGPYGYLPKGLVHEISGDSPRGLLHSVVAEQGTMTHDPHPSGAGITKAVNYGLFVALDPGKVRSALQPAIPAQKETPWEAGKQSLALAALEWERLRRGMPGSTPETIAQAEKAFWAAATKLQDIKVSMLVKAIQDARAASPDGKTSWDRVEEYRIEHGHLPRQDGKKEPGCVACQKEKP